MRTGGSCCRSGGGEQRQRGGVNGRCEEAAAAGEAGGGHEEEGANEAPRATWRDGALTERMWGEGNVGPSAPDRGSGCESRRMPSAIACSCINIRYSVTNIDTNMARAVLG
eukprot:3784923-Prymnesium_polylepis.1